MGSLQMVRASRPSPTSEPYAATYHWLRGKAMCVLLDTGEDDCPDLPERAPRRTTAIPFNGKSRLNRPSAQECERVAVGGRRRARGAPRAREMPRALARTAGISVRGSDS